MIPKERYAAIFDMDGTLVDSTDAIWGAHNKVLERFGVHLSEEDIRPLNGNSMRDNIQIWNERYGLQLDAKEFSQESWQYQLERLNSMKADEGLIGLLSHLQMVGVPMGVGTSSQRYRAEAILDIFNLRKYFPALVTANDVDKHKPEPDVFLEVARRLNMPAERCIVFEDAANGIDAAHRGGMKAIGYLNGHNNLVELKNADLVIRNFSEIGHYRLRSLAYEK